MYHNFTHFVSDTLTFKSYLTHVFSHLKKHFLSYVKVLQPRALKTLFSQKVCVWCWRGDKHCVKTVTWLKNSCRRHSSQGSETSMGRHSLEMSATFINIIISYMGPPTRRGRQGHNQKEKRKKEIQNWASNNPLKLILPPLNTAACALCNKI